MPRPKINYDLIERYILVTMYDAYVSDHNPVFSLQRIRGLLEIPNNVIRSCLETLDRRGEIEEIIKTRDVPDPSTMGIATGRTIERREPTGTYKLTNEGRRVVERLPDDQYDLALSSVKVNRGADVFAVNGAVALSSAPAWEPLPIERESDEVKTISGALSDLIEKVQSDNGYADTEPTERVEILAALKGAKDIINNASILTYTTFDIYLSAPILRLAKRFDSKTVIGQAAKILWDGVRAWVLKKIGTTLDDYFSGQ